MEIAKIRVEETLAIVISRKAITAGLTGATISVEYAPGVWDDLTKTVVFRGSETKDVVSQNSVIPVPPEAIAIPGKHLEVGLYGIDTDGLLIIPTIWCSLGLVLPGADPSGDTTTDPSLPVWAQIADQVEKLEEKVDSMTPGPGTGGNAEYVLPVGGEELGGVKNGGNVVINADGTMTAPNSGGNVELDVTLTQSGKAADAKATGDRVAKIETLTATTDLRGNFKDLPDGVKTVDIYSDGIFGETAYISTSEDFVPHGGFDRTFPFRNIVMAQKGRGWTLKGTAERATTIFFTDSEGNKYIPVSDAYAGLTIDALAFTSAQQGNIALVAEFYNADKTQLGKLSLGFKTSKKSTTLPYGTAFIVVYMYMQPDIAYDYEFQFYVLLSDNVRSIPLTGAVTKTEVNENTFDVIPYNSTASFAVPLKQYIDNYAGGGTVSYLTPEDFGALGDGSNDDGEAIAKCLQTASETGKSVMMAQKYYSSQPIVVTQNGLDVTINDFVYGGTDCALKISGRENTFKIHSIVSGGVGIGIYADNQKSTSYNYIDINKISSQSHGIFFYKGTTYSHQNTIRFSLIRAGGIGCYGIAFDENTNHNGFIAECNFYGGQIANCEWAVYRVGGNSRCYGFEIEDNVQGGFYTNESGGLVVFYPRHAESARDGTHAFLKYSGVYNTFVYLSAPLPINEIDLTDAIDVFEADNREHPLHESRFGVIYGQITDLIPEVGTSTYNAPIYAKETYIWGKNMIFKPHMDYKCEVTADILDTRLIGTALEFDSEFLAQLPTMFVVNSIDTTINLHASYCAFGISEFTIQQSGGYSAQVTDHLGNIIFDGSQFGDGTYKLKAWKDKASCDTLSSHLLRVDLKGQVWTVEPLLSAESYHALMGLVATTN